MKVKGKELGVNNTTQHDSSERKVVRMKREARLVMKTEIDAMV